MNQTADLYVVDDHKGELKVVPAKVGGQSLIGVGGEAPHRWANYFWLASGERVVNMWAENLEAAVPRFLDDGMVHIRRYEDNGAVYAMIVDDRIPEEWLYNKLCFTGTRLPSPEVALDMYSYYGDPDFEYEQFTDRRSYYAKRGGNFNEGGGFISYNAESRAAGEAYRESPRFKMEGYHAPLEVAG